MRIVIWQYILSVTDIPYTAHLMDCNNVDEVVIVAGKLSKGREKLGWDNQFPELKTCKVYTSPDDDVILQILKKQVNDSIHLFSGIRGCPHVFHAFKLSLNYPIKRGVISERPMTYAAGVDWAKPLWLHKLRFMLQNGKFLNRIDYLFAIGNEAYDYYNSISSHWKIFPFIYCTRDNNFERNVNDNICHITYVGSLSLRKSVITILKAVKRLNDSGYQDKLVLDIIGVGEQYDKLNNYALKHELLNINFLGMKKNNEIPSFLVNQDVLILPSIHDGWGAVVNESLLAGLYTICSDRCGSKDLLDDERRGQVFKMGDYKHLANILKYCCDNLNSIRADINYRRDWAQKSISGQVIAQYIIDCLTQEIKPVLPWK